VVAAVAGDREAAGVVELSLPETGVCGGSGLVDDPDGTSCAIEAPAGIQIGRARVSA
jgi:hypothetical protein